MSIKKFVPLDEKIEVFLMHKSGMTINEVSKVKGISPNCARHYCEAVSRYSKKFNRIKAGCSDEEKHLFSSLLPSIKDKSLSLKDRHGFVSLSQDAYKMLSCAAYLNLLSADECEDMTVAEQHETYKDNLKDMVKQKRVPKDPKEAELYWLRLENAFLKKQIEIGELMEREARERAKDHTHGRKKSER